VSYTNIKTLVNAQGTGTSSILHKNFNALKMAIPSIDAINNDDESAYDVASATAFSVMLYDIGFKTTLAPYMNESYWQSVATNVNKLRPGAVDRIDLQIYEGGAGNNPADWNINNIPLSVGMENFSSTSTIKSTMLNWKNSSTATGGFIWVYNDSSYDLKTYAAAIASDFGGGEVANRDKMRPFMTAYTQPDYLGTGVNFDKGDYNRAAIAGQGLTDKSLSSVKLAPGFKVTLYKKDNFAGESLILTTNDSNLVTNGMNDSISSWSVRANGDITLSGKVLFVKNRQSGLFMGVAGESKLEGATIQQGPLSGTTNQKWTFAHLGDGVYRIINKNSLITMQVRNGSTDNGAILEQGTYVGYDNQKLIVQQDGTSGYYNLIPYHSTKYLGTDGDQVNANIVQDSVNKDAGTDWQLIPNYSVMQPIVVLYPDCSFGGQGVNFEPGNYTSAQMGNYGLTNNSLSSVKVTPGFKVTLYDGDNLAGTGLNLTKDISCLTDSLFDNQTTSFSVKPNGLTGMNGVYYLQNRNSNLYMDVHSQSELDGASLEQATFTGSDSQKWVFTDMGDGVYTLINQKSGKAAEATALTDGAGIDQLTNSTANNQKFIVINGSTPESYQLVALQSGMVVDVNGGGTTEGVAIQQSVNQHQLSAEWKLVKTAGTGINETINRNAVRVYPDPVTDVLFIDHGQYSIRKVQIVDLQGRTLLMHEQNSQQVDVSTLRKGMYFIRVYLAGETAPVEMKFIKR